MIHVTPVKGEKYSWNWECRDDSGRVVIRGWSAGTKREAMADARDALSKRKEKSNG